MISIVAAILLTSPAAGRFHLAADQPLLLQQPTLSATQIAFSFAGDLWVVPREGGEAIRLTNGIGVETRPFFSPDGKTIAFTGEYDGNTDVFTIPASGGQPKRLTFNPEVDNVVGWTPDGGAVLFSSGFQAETPIPRLFTVSAKGGLPKALPLPSGREGSYAPDGTRIAYVPKIHWQDAWKRYRGGQTTPIWIAQLSDSSVQEIPRKNSNDLLPMWVGNKVYFLSDRNGPVTLFDYDLQTKKVAQLVKNDGFDLKSASAGPGAIVFEQFGGIHLYDLKTGAEHKVPISVEGDFPELRSRFIDVSDSILNGHPSPNGARMVFDARGDVFTVPANKGTVRNLTDTPGVAERDAAWSPDGRWIAYLSDQTGEYKLYLADPDGKKPSKSFDLAGSPTFYYDPTWSPDSKKIAYTDKRLNLWVLDVATGQSTKVDTDTYESPGRHIVGAWSPDSKWITYSRTLDSHMSAVFVYSLDTHTPTQVTDGLSNAKLPVFDPSGKYLYFVASTESGRANGWLDMTTYEAINALDFAYVMVLRKDLPSPLAPESDDEHPAPEGAAPPAGGATPPPGASGPKPPSGPEPVRIDFDNIGQRILALPMPAMNYQELGSGTEGSLFSLALAPLAGITSPPSTVMLRFDFASRRPTPFAQGVTGFELTPNGRLIMLQQGPAWSIVPSAAPPAPGQGAVKVAGLMEHLDPRAEWRQMFHEAWRIQRDFLYTPTWHGIDPMKMDKRYEPFLEGVVSRADLNYLFTEMLGETCVGHTFIRGGDVPHAQVVPSGLLGADYSLENGRYRLAKVFNGENWNPGLRAPLTQPGVNAVAGEYILSVNGRPLTASDNIYEWFEATAGKQVRVQIGPNPDGSGSREVVVVPIGSEAGLRRIDWMENNRRKVAALSGGKVGYVHLPDTNIGGYTNFNRYFYAQIDKEGFVADERFNQGGSAADYIVDGLKRKTVSYFTTREGKDFGTPTSVVNGPKVMITNEYAGSGGDLMPWLFKHEGVGLLVGTRTWGGLVGIYGYPPLIDGGSVTAPRVAFYGADGEWHIENHGVDPDIEVVMDPALWRKGRDPQLERAVEEVMKELAAHPIPKVKKPAYPDKSKLPPG